ncbi:MULTISPECIES: Dps family protein [Basfia]|uniref:Dps protein n=2 Tax=Basfia TaxID=697331 RepID=Q65UT3_MANSM|nr:MULTISPECIES: DNA starvation/stationary phase protection protein [Basfia]AAU37277.1 Dps protein [[Mannheimia] succiniciproducens MBEL55E]QIM68108.1 DNA starvation/stationary phase protection protein [Basfia succiniciproducens]SCX88274.1 starvation-inducible DNA-binding protein [Basfia succiniciproducens]
MNTKTISFPSLTLTEKSQALTADINKNATHSVPGIDVNTGHSIAEALQARLQGLNELALILKHAHWNVVGPQFIAVHEMLDSQVDEVRDFVDEIAERMAALGVAPNGLSGNLVANRQTPEYPLGRASAQDHLRIIDKFYSFNIESHRVVLAHYGELDPISEDLLVAQTRALEKLQWFIRAHLDNGNGSI